MSVKWIILGAFILTFAFSCSKESSQVVELRHFPITSLEEIITQTGVEFDEQVTSDGNGSLKITATDSVVIQLFEVNDIDIEDARLLYRAQIKTEGVTGQVFLEMWCGFKDKGEFFSRDLQTPSTGTKDWSIEETLFFLKKGENPDNVRLNLVVHGTGIVWIDDIHLLKAPLK